MVLLSLAIEGHVQSKNHADIIQRNLLTEQFSLKGRTALVTGGARGCGLAFAEGLAEAGADVAIFDIIPPVPEFFDIEKKYGVKTAHYQ